MSYLKSKIMKHLFWGVIVVALVAAIFKFGTGKEPEWFAALGTVGALIGTILLASSEKIEKKKEEKIVAVIYSTLLHDYYNSWICINEKTQKIIEKYTFEMHDRKREDIEDLEELIRQYDELGELNIVDLERIKIFDLNYLTDCVRFFKVRNEIQSSFCDFKKNIKTFYVEHHAFPVLRKKEIEKSLSTFKDYCEQADLMNKGLDKNLQKHCGIALSELMNNTD